MKRAVQSKRTSERCERASGPALTSRFLFVPDHSAVASSGPTLSRAGVVLGGSGVVVGNSGVVVANSGAFKLEEAEDELTDEELPSVGEDRVTSGDFATSADLSTTTAADLSASAAALAAAAAATAKPKGKDRVCRVCGMSGFVHRQALYRHIKKTHPHNQLWNCPICRAEFSCQNTFMDHYDHHRIIQAGETECRAALFEKMNVEKFMESLDDEEDGGGTSVGVAGGGGWASQEKLTHPPPEPPRIQT